MIVPELQDKAILLQQLSEGNELAFAQIFDHYRGQVYGTALKYLKSDEASEEIVQEIFLKVWIKRAEIPSIQNFNGFLFTMARNAITDRLRKMARERTAEQVLSKQQGFSVVDNTDHRVIDNQYQQIMEQAIDSLPPQQKNVFRLAKVEGYSYKEIADELGITVPTVKVHMNKALASMREYLKGRMGAMAFIPLLVKILTP